MNAQCNVSSVGSFNDDIEEILQDLGLGQKYNCKRLYEYIKNGNQTITHFTDIIDFNENQIGTFCETTGELANVYNHQPTLE